ncbi:MAG: hypothetical protein QF473_14860, partial [Planctomycetota bacterium]|nr:hypothetical protein [Planctomycetota bacterium]
MTIVCHFNSGLPESVDPDALRVNFLNDGSRTILFRCKVTLALCVCVMGACSAERPPLTPAVVDAKLDALNEPGWWEEHKEHPFGWLMQRREQIVPQLIAGLSGRRSKVARQCIQILDRVAPRPEIRDALIPIAQNHEHHLSLLATCGLRHYGDNARVRELLEQAYADKKRLWSSYHRAMVALGLNRSKVAAGLLLRQLSKEGGGVGYSTVELLGEIGAKTTVPGPKDALEKLIKGPKAKYVYVPARLALSSVLPEEEKYSLSGGQRTFLTEVARQWWMSSAEKDRKWAELARLDRDDLRPMVLSVLATEYPRPALAILRSWKDQAALPKLEFLIAKGRNSRLYAPVYLEIADTDEAVKRLDELTAYRKPRLGSITLHACMRARIPAERKLKLARLYLDRHGWAASASLPGAIGQAGPDTESLLIPLMSEENDLGTLACYARLAARYDSEEAGEQLRRALSLAVTMGVRGPSPEMELMPGGISSVRYSAARIMDAAAASPLAGCGRLANDLLAAKDERIRLAAANLAAGRGGNRSKAIRLLLDVLKRKRHSFQQMAADYLRHLPPLSADEKKERETAILSALGTPSEDEALHALTNCAGQKTVERLTPLLNHQDFWRALRVTWVFAHHPTEEIRERALRRLSIFSLFWCEKKPWGTADRSDMAKLLEGLLFPDWYSRVGQWPELQPLKIPGRLLKGFSFSPDEQQFADRVYSTSFMTDYSLRWMHPLDFGEWWGDQGTRGHRTHLPLLRLIAEEDANLEALVVNGKKIGHFPYRRRASALIAAITGQPAHYRGLQGEEFRSDRAPQRPYPEQTRLVAAWMLGRLKRELADVNRRLKEARPVERLMWSYLRGHTL